MKKYYLIGLSILIIIFSVCSKQDINPVSIENNEDSKSIKKEYTELEDNLNLLAQQIAISLNDKTIV
jgi:hypothetical protein